MPNNYLAASPIDEMISYFEKYTHIPAEMKTFLIRDSEIKSYSKNKFLVSPLDQSPNVYFLIKGAVRGFIRDEGEEVTTWLSLENHLVGLTLFPTPQHVEKKQYIQSLEDTEVVIIPHSLIKILYSLFHEMEILGRKLLWQHYQESDERNFIIRLSTAKKRIERLKKTCPEVFNRIQLKHIASYLGMRLETLSRLKSD